MDDRFLVLAERLVVALENTAAANRRVMDIRDRELAIAEERWTADQAWLVERRAREVVAAKADRLALARMEREERPYSETASVP